jgi:hypothetical protein
MDILEQFLHSIAYKFPKGYPDMDNKQDVLILENEFKKIGIDLEELKAKPHWNERIGERGTILDIVNFPKDYSLSKQEVTKQIEDELIRRSTNLEKLKEVPLSLPYKVGYKLFKPLLNYNGKNIPLNLKVEYTVKGVKKIGIGNSFVAVISDDALITLLLLPRDDNPTIELSMEKHEEREKGKPKPIKLISSSNYEFIIAPKSESSQLVKITDLPYKIKTSYRPGTSFTHDKYGTGIITAAASAGTRSGEPDSRGMVDWIEVKYKTPYVSGGQLRDTRRFEKLYTLIAPDFNARAAE